jgi:hypothetical protein
MRLDREGFGDSVHEVADSLGDALEHHACLVHRRGRVGALADAVSERLSVEWLAGFLSRPS